MKTNPQPRRRPSPHGMTLLEVMLALMIFAIAAVAYVGAINQMGESVIITSTVRNVEIGLSSYLDEYSKAPQIQELDKEFKADENGIIYRIVIKPVENLKNKQNQPIVGIFRVLVTAKWKDGGNARTMEAETLRYAGMYANLQ